MYVVDAVPKDIHYLIDASASELKSLLVLLDNMVFNRDSNNPEHVKADEFLHSEFYPLIKKLVEGDQADGA